MHTSRLTTLLFTILSVSTASHASQNQQNETYYQVKVKDSKQDTRFLFIWQNTPVIMIKTHMSQEELTNMVINKSHQGNNEYTVSNQYHFDKALQSVSDNNLSWQDFLNNYVSFPSKPSKENTDDSNQIIQKIFIGTMNPSNAQNNTLSQGSSQVSFKPTQNVKKVRNSAAVLIEDDKFRSTVFAKGTGNNTVDIIKVDSKNDISKLDKIAFPAPKKPTINIKKNNNVGTSPSSVSMASQNQQNEKYYSVRLHDSIQKLFIQQSTPVSTIKAYLEQHSLPYKMELLSRISDNEVHQYHFSVENTSFLHNKVSFQELLNNHVSFPTTPSKSESILDTTLKTFNGTIKASISNKVSFSQLELGRDQVIKRASNWIKPGSKVPSTVFEKSTENNTVDIIEVKSENDISKLQKIVSPAQSKPKQININNNNKPKQVPRNDNINILNNNNLNDNKPIIVIKKDNPKSPIKPKSKRKENMIREPGALNNNVGTSPSSVSMASQNQQNEKYYQAAVKDSSNKKRYLFIWQNTPVATIKRHMSQKNLSNMAIHKSHQGNNEYIVSNQYHFDNALQSVSDNNLSWQDFLNNHVFFPTTPSDEKKDDLTKIINKTFRGTINASNAQNTTLSQSFSKVPFEPTKDFTEVRDTVDKLVKSFKKMPCTVFAKGTRNNTVNIIEVNSENEISNLNNTVAPAQNKPKQINIKNKNKSIKLKQAPRNNNINILNDNKAKVINTTNTSQKSNFNTLLSPSIKLLNDETPLSSTNEDTLLSPISNTNLNNKQTKISLISNDDNEQKSTPKPINQNDVNNNNNLNDNIGTLLSPTSNTNANNEQTNVPLTSNNDNEKKSTPKPINQNDVNNNNINDNNLNDKSTSRLLIPPKLINQNIANNNNQNTPNNNNNNTSNKAGTYILVVFGLAVCAGIVYSITQKSPTSKSHKRRQDAPQQTS